MTDDQRFSRRRLLRNTLGAATAGISLSPLVSCRILGFGKGMLIVGESNVFCLGMEPSSAREKSSLLAESRVKKSKDASSMACLDRTAPSLSIWTVVSPSGAVTVC